jgi:hypothetical protein
MAEQTQKEKGLKRLDENASRPVSGRLGSTHPGSCCPGLRLRGSVAACPDSLCLKVLRLKGRLKTPTQICSTGTYLRIGCAHALTLHRHCCWRAQASVQSSQGITQWLSWHVPHGEQTALPVGKLCVQPWSARDTCPSCPDCSTAVNDIMPDSNIQVTLLPGSA